MSAPTSEVKVTRDGVVYRGGKRFGYLDRYDPRNLNTLQDWRWVRVGGATSPTRFATRREALAALLEQP